jgi:hypothetical protein
MLKGMAVEDGLMVMDRHWGWLRANDLVGDGLLDRCLPWNGVEFACI